MKNSREQWGSRLGFILAASGSAVGIGNIWKFYANSPCNFLKTRFSVFFAHFGHILASGDSMHTNLTRRIDPQNADISRSP